MAYKHFSFNLSKVHSFVILIEDRDEKCGPYV